MAKSKEDKKTKAIPKVEVEKQKRKKAPAVPRYETPSVLVPLAIILIVELVLGILDFFHVLQTKVVLLAASILVVAFLVFLPTWVAAPLLKNKKSWLLVGCFTLLFLISGIIGVWSLVSFSDLKAKGTISRQSRNSTITFTDSGKYFLYLRAQFPEEKEKKRKLKILAPYKVTFNAPDGRSKTYQGEFERIHELRRMSKRGLGYHDVNLNAQALRIRLKKPGEATLFLEDLGDKVKDELSFEVYQDTTMPFVIASIGVIVIGLGGLIDFLMKKRKATGVYGFLSAATFGFLVYYYLDASPFALFGTMAMDFFIGGVLGLLLGYGITYVLERLYQKLDRSFDFGIRQ